MALVLGSSTFAMAANMDSVTFNNWEPVQTSLANIESGSLRTHVFTVGGYNLGRIDFAGTLEEINGTTGDFGTESWVRVKYPDGRFKDVQMSGTTGYTGVLPIAGSFFLAPGESAPFGGGTWLFYYVNTFDDAPTGGVPDCVMNVTFTLTDEVPMPPAAIDLGTIGSPGLTRTDPFATPGYVQWYKFVVSQSTAGTGLYVDIDTEGTFNFLGGTFTNDTFIGLYSSTGDRIATDDDDGSAFLSQLTFGPSAGSRPNMGGLDYDGRDGDLAPGTYYLAVSGWPTTWGPDNWQVTPGHGHTGEVVLNFRTNIGGAPTGISGTVTLQDRDDPTGVGEQVVIEIRFPGGLFPIHTEIVTLGAGGTYSFPVPGILFPGTYDVTAKHAKHLRKKIQNVNITATGASGLDYSLFNGDCDDDNEIGIGDFAVLSAAFGSDPAAPNWNPMADLDGDEEVSIGDYGILSVNFEMIGD